MTEAEGHEIVARATRIERDDERFQYERLRLAAIEAGVDASALTTAEREYDAERARQAVPSWIRIGLLGVPNREAAHIWYFILTLGFMISGALLIIPALGASPKIAFASTIWFAVCSWSHSRLIRWCDAHGWPKALDRERGTA